MKKIVLTFLSVVCLVGVSWADDYPFFAMDNGLRNSGTLAEKAALLKELGYAGACWRVKGGETVAMKKELNKLGLKMLTSYTFIRIRNGEIKIDDGVWTEIETFRGTGAAIWLIVHGAREDEDRMVEPIRQMADKAKEADVSIVLYPHVGKFVTDTTRHCLSLAEKVDRDNVGVSFNLCHFLKQHDETELEAVLREAKPYLRIVQVSGADSGDTKNMEWDQLIQPLGKGTFNVGKVVKILKDMDWKGPVALQCYKVPGDDRENLKLSIQTWKQLIK